jgi:hypothetical protein
MSGSILPTITHVGSRPLYGIASGVSTLAVSTILSVGPPGEILVYADADTKLKTFVDAGTSTIREVMTNGAGAVITPAIVFKPETNSLLVQGTNGSTILVATTGQNLTVPGTLNVSSIAMPASASVTFGTSLAVARTGDSLTMDLFQDGNDNVSLALTTPNNDNVITVGADGGAGKIEVATGPLQIFASDLAVYSSITTFNLGVSSINNAAYPPQSSGAVSTIGFSAANFPGGSGTISSNSTPLAITDSFVVGPDRRYRLSYEASFGNSDATSYTTVYLSGTTPTFYFQTVSSAYAIPGQNDARASASGTFVPTVSTCQLIGATNSATSGTNMALNAAAGVVLEDLGPV